MKELADGFVASCNDTTKLFYITGAVQSLVEIFKTGHRNDLMPRVDIIFDAILKTEVTNNFNKNSSVLKKDRVNLAQRIGCIFLKPRVASWRYQRGARSLASNLNASAGILTSSN
jgi:tubulin-specific chaperone D